MDQIRAWSPLPPERSLHHWVPETASHTVAPTATLRAASVRRPPARAASPRNGDRRPVRPADHRTGEAATIDPHRTASGEVRRTQRPIGRHHRAHQQERGQQGEPDRQVAGPEPLQPAGGHPGERPEQQGGQPPVAGLVVDLAPLGAGRGRPRRRSTAAARASWGSMSRHQSPRTRASSGTVHHTRRRNSGTGLRPSRSNQAQDTQRVAAGHPRRSPGRPTAPVPVLRQQATPLPRSRRCSAPGTAGPPTGAGPHARSPTTPSTARPTTPA